MATTSRIASAFAALKEQKHAAFMPFFTVGDPDLAATEALVKEAAARGADLIELGVPFSDPIADGPTIQASYDRALRKGFKVAQVFELARKLRAGGLKIPLLCMVSESLVYKRGLDAFLKAAKEAGYDGLIVPDLPAGYEGDASARAAAAGLDLVFLCAPTTTPERRALIAERSSGFVYYVSVAGITGVRDTLPEDMAQNVKDLKARAKTPVCVGFGISRPEQAAAVARIADGAIVGSALVKLAAELAAKGTAKEELVKQVGAQIEALAKATHGA
ncbi:MAG: tryptophan synthase subunit alpha [Planctomycetes bacterium]|nr:tryptophan synthase subunit alpha [Planctomycetota bacterium]